MATAYGIDVEPLREIELDRSLDGDGVNIFEAFEVASGNAGDKIDPYPEFHRMRREDPVYRVPEDAAGRTYYRNSDRPVFQVYRHEDVSRVAQESDLFTSEHHSEGIGQIFGKSILEMNGDEHAMHRRLIQHAFKRRDLARWKETLIPDAVNQAIDAIIDRGEADLTREFTLLYPVKVIEAMMGLPKEHVDWFHRRAIEEISMNLDPERAVKASLLLKDYFRQVIEIRREHPGEGDIITLLIEADAGGKRLSTDEIIPFLMLLAPAGAETTYRGTGTLLFALLDNPEQFERVKQDRSLIPRAIEEAMRWDPPLTFLGRRVSQDVTFQGITLPAGSNVSACLASANRDPEYCEPGDTADQFDLFRPRKPNLTFAAGAHVCLGQILAREEMGTALNLVIDRLPGLHIDPEQKDRTYMTGETWRSPNQLPVRWEV
ncbi:cytochrome P450 [Myxococcota bacterium]|nr:cytochrome P450 [Myxococcota bacterium]